MRLLFTCVLAFTLLLVGCSGIRVRQSRVFSAGEKATVGQLTYSVIDSDIQTRVGEDANPRFPQTRFVIVQLAVSNSSNAGVAIPGLTLVDDSGKTYPELADGTGVPHWLGVDRKVDPVQTERGSVLFDAPSAHYKLKLTDESNDSDTFIDIPLTFIHERLNDVTTPDVSAPMNALPAPDPGSLAQKKNQKK
jgi:hypothetical protein